MSIPKAGSRLLRLDGGVYRWRVRGRPTYCQANGWGGLLLAVEDAAHPGGAVLVVSLGVTHPSNWLKLPSRAVLPAKVSEWVQQALALGWQPSAPGAQFLLSASSTKGGAPNHTPQELTAHEKATGPSSRPVPQAGLHEGAWDIPDDFDDPLPDEFWLGEDA